MTATDFRLAAKRLFFPSFNLGVRSRLGLSKFFLAEKDIRTLDVGCGNGCFTYLASRRGGSVLGVSFDAEQISRCREFYQYRGVPENKLEFKVMNAREMSAMTEQFDQILLLEVMEHIDNDREVLTNIARRLKPGGVLHLSTPNITLGPWVGVLNRKATGGHCRLGYSRDRLEFLVRKAGLDLAYATRIGGWGDYLAPLQLRLSHLLGDSFPAEGFVFCLLYPFYLLLRLVPIPQSARMFEYLIARKPCSEPEA